MALGTLVAFGIWTAALSGQSGLAPLPDPPPYQTPVHPADPAAQLAEMLGIYDSVCLKAFPDDAAVARAMAERAAPPLSAAQIRRYLHEDPGTGWRIVGRTASFDVTIEAPPFHSCGVRTVAAAAFPDMAPYRALADRFETGGGYRSVGAFDRVADDVRSLGSGESRHLLGGGAESLFVFVGTPVPASRKPGQDATEIRFVRQLAPPPPPAQPQT